MHEPGTGRVGLLPTTKHRRGRVTNRQAAALAADSGNLLPPGPVDLAAEFDDRPVLLDIGFGTGEAVVALAAAQPLLGILAVDMHTPGIGDLLARLEDERIHNVRVIDADARTVLADWLAESSLVGVRTYFPDPWPKKRHHRRRLIQPTFVELVASRVRIGGSWHLATDWPDYADQMLEVFDASQSWDGGVLERPEWRPITRYERRALTAGRSITDLWFVRVCP